MFFSAGMAPARQRLIDVEMVTPAGELDTVVPHLFDEWCELDEREIGQLAGEQGDGPWLGAGKEDFFTGEKFSARS